MRTVKTPALVRQLGLMTAVAAPLLALGCTNNSNENATTNVNGPAVAATPPLYKNVPGAVTGDRASGINATFKIIQAAGGIPSDRLGGACIVFRAQDLGYDTMAAQRCSRDEDCGTGEAIAHYCQKSTKQCLARPNVTGPKDPYCKRSIDPDFLGKHWPADVDIPISDNPIAVPANLKPNAQAFLITLLKRKAPANAPPVLEFGAATPIP